MGRKSLKSAANLCKNRRDSMEEGAMKIFREIKKEVEDFERNKEVYFSNLKKVAKMYNARIFVFGSYLEKEKFTGASDVDVLVVLSNFTPELKYEILRKLKEAVNENSRLEFHVNSERDFELRKVFIKNLEEL